MKWLLYLLRFILCVLLFSVLLWSLAAFWFQLPGGLPIFILIAPIWFFMGCIAIAGEWYRHPPLLRWKTRLSAIIMFAIFALFWSNIKPSLYRDWDASLAHTVEGTIKDDTAYLKNIRDFNWTTPDQGEVHWRDESYNLNQITGINLYLSYWMGPYIAHTLVGFNFADGRHLVFSSEIRREKHEQFSAIGGFFRQFELAMIAATEEDIIKLRSDIRREQVFRYPLDVTPEKARELFTIYIKTADQLAKTPRFYNTLTTNCTTVVFDMARLFDPGIPMDLRIVFSGQLPAYLYDHQLIDTSRPLIDLVKSAHLEPRNHMPRQDYSKAIRNGL